MGVTALPSSLLPPRRAAAAAAAAAPRAACASRCRLDPARIGAFAAASSRAADASCRLLDPARIGGSAAANEPKWPGSRHDDEPPTKRRRAGVEDAGAARHGKAAMSSAEKNCVKRLRLFLPPLENGDEIEIGVNALSGAIKGRVAAYQRGRPMPEEVLLSQSKDRVIGQSKPRCVLSKAAAPKSNPPRAGLKSIPPTSNPLRAAPTIIPSKTALKSRPPKPDLVKSVNTVKTSISQSKEGIVRQSKPRSIPPRPAASKSIPPRAAPESIPSKAALRSIPARAVPLLQAPPRPSENRELVIKLVKTVKSSIGQSSLMGINSKAVTSKSIPQTAASSLQALSKPSQSKKSVRKLSKISISQSPQRSAPPTAVPSHSVPLKPAGSPRPMKELLAAAKKAMKNSARRREIEKLRAAARWEVEKVVRTVEFNDPYIDYTDVFM